MRIPSFGTYQFKVTTVQHYLKLKTGETLTVPEAVAIAFDGEKARELASFVIFETEKGVASDWFHCERIAGGLDSLVRFIKSHERI